VPQRRHGFGRAKEATVCYIEVSLRISTLLANNKTYMYTSKNASSTQTPSPSKSSLQNGTISSTLHAISDCGPGLFGVVGLVLVPNNENGFETLDSVKGLCKVEADDGDGKFGVDGDNEGGRRLAAVEAQPPKKLLTWNALFLRGGTMVSCVTRNKRVRYLSPNDALSRQWVADGGMPGDLSFDVDFDGNRLRKDAGSSPSPISCT
jgi:hypothetical protein